MIVGEVADGADALAESVNCTTAAWTRGATAGVDVVPLDSGSSATLSTGSGDESNPSKP